MKVSSQPLMLFGYNASITVVKFNPYPQTTVGIKSILDDLEVTAAQVRVTAAKHELLMLLVQKLLLLVLKVNAAGIKVTTAERLQLLKEFMLTEKRSKTYQRKNKD
ncbi:hypothetical protein Tco_1501535 [Tanacetum coccineum]